MWVLSAEAGGEGFLGNPRQADICLSRQAAQPGEQEGLGGGEKTDWVCSLQMFPLGSLEEGLQGSGPQVLSEPTLCGSRLESVP